MKFVLPFLYIVAFLPIGCTPSPKVKAVSVQRGEVEATVSSVTSGAVKSEKLAELAFGAVGRVSRLNVRVGDRVHRNAILAELENEDLLSALHTAQAEANRQEDLFRKKAAAVAQLDKARSALELARIAHEKTLIRAPFDGQIVELNLEVGQLSQITAIIPKPMMRIVDLEPRYVQAEVDEVDLSKVKQDMPARVKILAVRREPFHGRVRKLIPFISSIREQDRTTQLELDVQDDGVLLPVGASADVEIIIERQQDVLMIPSRAVSGRAGGRHVFRLQGGKAVRVSIEVGLFNYDRSEVRSGVNEGDIVLLPADSVELVDGMAVETESISWP